MRLFAFLAVTLLAGIPLGQQRNTGVVEGIVTKLGTSEPLPNVQVTLRAGASSRLATIFSNALPGSVLTADLLESRMAAAGASNGTPVRFTTRTDARGRFIFRELAMGDYWVSASQEGYFGPTLPSGAFTTVVASSAVLNETQPTSAISLSLGANATITGHVINTDGQSLPEMKVSAYLPTYARDGRRVLVPVGLVPRGEPVPTTNDRGEYRLFNLPPGEYFIGVTPPAVTSVSPRGAYVTTFHPSAVDAPLASPLALRGGEERTVDVLMQRFPTVKISGRIASTLSGWTRPTTRFYLISRKSAAIGASEPPVFVNAITDAAALGAGEFEIHGVLPGSYDLMAVLAPWTSTPDDPAARPLGNPIPGRVRIDVGTRDVEGVVLPVYQGVDVRIRLILDGEASSIRKESIRPYLWAKENWASPFELAMYHPGQTRGPRLRADEPAPVPPPLVDSSGSYTFSNVAPATYIIEMLGLPPTAAVIDIDQAGAGSIYDSGFIVGASPPGDIQVSISTAAPSVEGNVYDAERRLRPNAQVALVPQDPRRQNRFLYKLTQTDPSGHFTFQGVAPGEYKVFAWDSLPINAHLNADFIAKYESRGQTHRVDVGSAVLPIHLELISLTPNP